MKIEIDMDDNNYKFFNTEIKEIFCLLEINEGNLSDYTKELLALAISCIWYAGFHRGQRDFVNITSK